MIIKSRSVSVCMKCREEVLLKVIPGSIDVQELLECDCDSRWVKDLPRHPAPEHWVRGEWLLSVRRD